MAAEKVGCMDDGMIVTVYNREGWAELEFGAARWLIIFRKPGKNAKAPYAYATTERGLKRVLRGVTFPA